MDKPKPDLKEMYGGAWKNAAMQNIKKYLEEELREMSRQFTVIA